MWCWLNIMVERPSYSAVTIVVLPCLFVCPLIDNVEFNSRTQGKSISFHLSNYFAPEDERFIQAVEVLDNVNLASRAEARPQSSTEVLFILVTYNFECLEMTQVA